VADAARAASDSLLIRTRLREAWPGVGFGMESALWADPIQIPSPAGVLTTQIQPASLEGISAQVTLTAGKWPGLPHHGGPLPVALPAAAASRLHLTLGSVLTGDPQPSGAPISLQVTGLFRPRNPASLYCADRTPDRMSGGEQQRAAIATALANQPKVLLADEPTGELDSVTARDVFSALQTANTELGVTVLVVTHDPAVSSQVRRTIAIRDGKTSSETIRHTATDERGETTLHAREYATLDRAGRVQLPREMTRRLRMRKRVELQEEPDHIGVWPDQPADQEPQ
jgi:ABC transporter